MKLQKTLNRLLPLGMIFFITCCGSTNSNSPSSFNSSPDVTAVQAASLCPSSNPAFAGGNGTSGSPYQISQFCHFYAYSANPLYWSQNVVMTADLDLSGLSFSPMITMTGTFNGNGHKISNWVNSGPLFVTNAGTISNVNLINVNMTPLGAARPAPLVGTNLSGGTVSNCSAQGSINGMASATLDSDNDIYWFVGGLVSINLGMISHSKAAVNLTGLEDIGGLVGHNEGTIQTSFATGTVVATTSGANNSGNFGAGGLVGTNIGGTIENSYATGSVQGADEVGGLIGYSTGPVQDCFASGATNGTGTNLGGLIGLNSGGAITSSYWDTTTSSRATSSGGTGEATAAMQTAATFTSWDFTNTWNAPAGGYPTLR